MNASWNNELRMTAIIFMLLMVAAVVKADKMSIADGLKENPIPSENAPLDMHNEPHIVAKRAWQQLQSGWGKRNFEDDQKEETIEELRHKLLKLYSEQLLNNRLDETEYVPEDYNEMAEKRAWKSMGNAWGKRDWSQMRGSGWGKRTPGWNKLSSAWGK